MKKLFFLQVNESDKCNCITKVIKGRRRCVKPACDPNGCNDKARCVQKPSKSSQASQSFQASQASQAFQASQVSQVSQSSQSCKLTMYDQTYFRGKSVDITANVNNFKSVNFDNTIASVKIKGTCCWTLFVDKNFQGASVELKTGEYQSATNIIDVFKKASSAKSNC